MNSKNSEEKLCLSLNHARQYDFLLELWTINVIDIWILKHCANKRNVLQNSFNAYTKFKESLLYGHVNDILYTDRWHESLPCDSWQLGVTDSLVTDPPLLHSWLLTADVSSTDGFRPSTLHPLHTPADSASSPAGIRIYRVNLPSAAPIRR